MDDKKYGEILSYLILKPNFDSRYFTTRNFAE
ncbi:hypothetical protein BafHLJ01_0874 [Borreliella afzelii HLJ01]|nr:hypothetical protein BafHLJ01_0874 [Borreliella afzelii HLJ01]